MVILLAVLFQFFICICEIVLSKKEKKNKDQDILIQNKNSLRECKGHSKVNFWFVQDKILISKPILWILGFPKGLDYYKSRVDNLGNWSTFKQPVLWRKSNKDPHSRWASKLNDYLRSPSGFLLVYKWKRGERHHAMAGPHTRQTTISQNQPQDQHFSIAYSIPSFMNPERQEEWQVIPIQTSIALAYYEMHWENMHRNEIAKIWDIDQLKKFWFCESLLGRGHKQHELETRWLEFGPGKWLCRMVEVTFWDLLFEH